jgi:formate/nitrite transporter FocA (FNT family)
VITDRLPNDRWEAFLSTEQQHRIGRTQAVVLHRALLGGLVVCVVVFAILLYTS